MGYEEVERKEVERMEITPTGKSGSRNILRQLPYDSSEWFQTVGEVIRGHAEVDEYDYGDDEVIAVAKVEMVQYHHPTTAEFKIAYEGMWEWAETDETEDEEVERLTNKLLDNMGGYSVEGEREARKQAEEWVESGEVPEELQP